MIPDFPHDIRIRLAGLNFLCCPLMLLCLCSVGCLSLAETEQQKFSYLISTVMLMLFTSTIILTAFLIWFYDANAILLLFWSRKPFRNISILFELRCLYCKNCLHHHNSRKHEWTYNSGSWNLKSPLKFISSWIVMFLLENLNEIMSELIQ